MDLYLKAGPTGSDVGDCPFAHYVRMVIAVKSKGDECTVKPCVQASFTTYTVTQLHGYIGFEAVEVRSSGYPTGQQASYCISPTGRQNISQICLQTSISM